MAQLNLALRFLLELAGIAAVAYWGYNASSGTLRWILAVGAAVVLIAVWAVVIAPKADNRIPQDARILLGSAVLLIAAALLFTTDQRVPALVLGALVVVNSALIFVLRE